MILIYPPIAKSCEPPAGLARLAGTLNQNRISCEMVDANLEGVLYLLNQSVDLTDTWSRRAERRLSENLEVLRSRQGYFNIDRYRQAVFDVNRLLLLKSRRADVHVGLGNYQDNRLSPVRSDDLIRASETPEANPFYSYFSLRLRSLLEQHPQSPVVGFSINYMSQALCAFAMIGFLKKEYPGVRIVLGGGLVTSWMRMPHWRNPFAGFIDDMVAGPGESALLLIAGKSSVAAAPVRPDYSGFPHHEYMAPGPILPYSASSGCYWQRCSFCPERAEGNPYSPVPVKEVIRQLQCLTSETRPSLIHLLDNAVSPSLLKALALDPPGAPWYGFARVSRSLTNPDFCRKLKRSGCVMLKLGLESGDQGVLDDMQKGIRIEQASQVLRNLHEAGIAAYVYLLFGTPTETADSAAKTLDFAVRHSRYIGFLNLAVFNLPAWGPDAEGLETRPFYEGDLGMYRQFVHPRGWNRKEVRRFLDREFRRHPAILPILRGDPPVFTSNHAPFFVLFSRQKQGR